MTSFTPLSLQSKEVVAATLPAIGAAIDDIARRFYETMFGEHPELLANLFNRGNQASGDQPKALASSVAIYGTFLVTDDAPSVTTMMDRIANKHASLAIAPDQYPIVHKYLFGAIAEILGDAVTPEVAKAWDEVFWNMANALIAKEKCLYDNAGVTPQNLWSDGVITASVDVARNVKAITLSTSWTSGFVPGQYISVQAGMGDGAQQIRQYSIVDHAANSWTIGVKREGEMSSFLHSAEVGTPVRVSPPFGESVVRHSGPLTLITCGIGCTPTLSILKEAVRSENNRHIHVLHADASAEDHPFRDDILALVGGLANARCEVFYSSLGQRLDCSQVAVTPGSLIYICGPQGFMDQAERSLRSCGHSDIITESFAPVHE